MGILIDSAHVDSTRLHLLPGLIVAGFGLGMTFAPLQTIAMRDVEPQDGRRRVRHHQHDAPARRGHRIGRRRRAAAVAAVDEARRRRTGADQRTAQGRRPAVAPRTVRPRVQGRRLGRARGHRATERARLGHSSAGAGAGPDRRRVEGDLRQWLHQRHAPVADPADQRHGPGRGVGAAGSPQAAQRRRRRPSRRHRRVWRRRSADALARRRTTAAGPTGTTPGLAGTAGVSRGRRRTWRRRRRRRSAAARRPRPPRPPAARTGSGAPSGRRVAGPRSGGRSARRAGSRCRGCRA